VSVVNSVTSSIWYGSGHSVFIDDFKVYCYSIFAGDLWISRDIVFLIIPWVCPDSIFAIDLMRQSWIQWRYRLHTSAVTQYSLTISRSTVTLFSPSICGSPWHSVLDNSMHQLWLYFCSLFDASVVNSVTLSIPYGNGHSVFIEDFKVYCYSVFTGDLWITHDIAFLTIPSVSHDSIFSIDLFHCSWIHWRCQFHTSAITQYSLTISRSTITLFSPLIYGSTVT